MRYTAQKQANQLNSSQRKFDAALMAFGAMQSRGWPVPAQDGYRRGMHNTHY
jgi:hypothetical protein